MPPTAEILRALHGTKYVKGHTHGFYRYPAATAPELIRELLDAFSEPGDLICDPFVGGGTVVVEALAGGRPVLASDLNELAVFVSRAKTSPLSEPAWDAVEEWAADRSIFESLKPQAAAPRAWLPDPLGSSLAVARGSVGRLPPAARLTARCALLRVGQWALESRDELPEASELHDKLRSHTRGMRTGMADLVEAARSAGVPKGDIRASRAVRCCAADALGADRVGKQSRGRVKLLLSSPPYPGVHVLYHRWQVEGRRETAAPYWLIGAQDGHYMPYYTMGGRTAVGLRRYFERLTRSFQALRPLLAPDALVALIVGFSNPAEQLPAFHGAMFRAGYDEADPLDVPQEALTRDVPNRRWYVRVRGKGKAASRELLLFYRPRKPN